MRFSLLIISVLLCSCASTHTETRNETKTVKQVEIIKGTQAGQPVDFVRQTTTQELTNASAQSSASSGIDPEIIPSPSILTGLLSAIPGGGPIVAIAMAGISAFLGHRHGRNKERARKDQKPESEP